jgi:PPOX class probable F420-dependent enzyme
MTVLDELGQSRYISLTSYRKDGTPVATPVWHVPADGELLIVSEADTWKVKRIRNDGKVQVTVCDLRGRIKPGAPSATGTARLLDEPGTERARKLLAQRYLMSRVVHVRRKPMIGIAVTL